MLSAFNMSMLFILILSIMAPAAECSSDFLQLNSKREVMAYYEDHSFYPILHLYYNRHFSSSKQFKHFKADVLEEVQLEMRDYARIVFTDCEKEEMAGSEQDGSLVACKEIKRLNENRMMIGYEPSSDFINFG